MSQVLVHGSPQRWLRVILVLALVLRVGWACGLQYMLDHHWHRQFLIEGDANGYWELAHRIAAGEDFAIYKPPRHVLRMPGFPALLAGSIHLFGENLFVVRLVLALVGTLGCALVYLLGCKLADEWTGVIAAGLAAVAPTLVGFSPVVLSETTFAVCLTAGIVTQAKLHLALAENVLHKTARVWLWSLCTGMLISLACYMRPSWLLWAPVSIFLLFLPLRSQQSATTGWKEKLAAALLIVIGTLGPLAPWGLRNQRVTGHFVLTTLWSGPSLYDGLNAQATGDSDMDFFDRENLLGSMTEYEVNEEYKRRAWRFARENPGRALELAWIKFCRYWSPIPNADQFSNLWMRLAVGVGTVLMFVPAVIGIWVGRRDWLLLALTVGPILYFCSLHLLFVSSLRYRLPAEYPLLVLSAVGLQAAVLRAKSKLFE